MSQINQTGNNNQGSTGANSPNTQGDNNTVILSSKQKAGWFTGGILLPVIAGIIIEIIKKGQVSDILSTIIGLFTK